MTLLKNSIALRQLRRSMRGLTAVEVLIVLTIVAVLAATAIPNLASMLERYRASGAADDLQHTLMSTRAQAIAAGNRAVVAPLMDNEWVNGWRIFLDPNNNGTLDAGERVIQIFEARNPELSITPSTRLFEGGESRISFTQFGFPRALNGTTFADGSFVVTVGATSRTVCLDVQGHSRVIESGGC